MKRCLVLLNHCLTPEQEEDLRNMGYSPKYPPEEIQKLWGQVPTTPTGDEEVADLVAFYVNAVMAPEAAIVQGEMGTTFKVVSALKGLDIPCYHAVSRRTVEEIQQKDGTVEKKAIFHHVIWREY